MKTCEDCIGDDFCYLPWRNFEGKEIREYTDEGIMGLCRNFKDKSKFIELPCSIGDTVYYPYAGKILEKKVTAYHCIYDERSGVQGIDWWYELDNDEGETMDSDLIGNTIFLTREEAEKKLQEFNNNAKN